MKKNDVLKEIDEKWYDSWDNTGWKSIWHKYCETVKDYVLDHMSDKDFEDVDEISLDSKEKYGTLDIFTYPRNIDKFDEHFSAASIAEAISEYTCIKCGAQPKNEKGEHIIYTSRGWICPYCEDCKTKLEKEEDIRFDKSTLKDNIFTFKRWSKDSSKEVDYKWIDDRIEIADIREM